MSWCACPVKADPPRHVSNSRPASGMTNTVMSSPEPSLSLGSRHPRSLRTPRDRIRRSCAARVYLEKIKTNAMLTSAGEPTNAHF